MALKTRSEGFLSETNREAKDYLTLCPSLPMARCPTVSVEMKAHTVGQQAGRCQASGHLPWQGVHPPPPKPITP